jgi:hypothetical protein
MVGYAHHMATGEAPHWRAACHIEANLPQALQGMQDPYDVLQEVIVILRLIVKLPISG